MTWQAVAASGADGLASGGFLAAFALLLGASNVEIGMMTALPFIMQPLQILAVAVVERIRARKVIAVPAYWVAYSVWVPIALIPFAMEIPSAAAISALLLLIAVRGTANAFVNASWMGWMREVIPDDIRGRFMAMRTRRSTLAAAVVGMTAALYIDYWKGTAGPDEVAFGYSFAMLFGSIVLGWTSVYFMARVPEPKMMESADRRPSLRSTISAPLGDRNYRGLMAFLFAWNFATHLALPFFTVYMLVRLELPLTLVVGLTVIGQLFAVLFRLWGPLIDQFGSKVVLSMATSLYLLVILGWAFTTMPEKYFLTIPLLIALHIFAGIANAGINIASMTLRMKLAPRAQSTAFLTGASLAVNLGAGISPLLGGAFADFFSVRQFAVNLSWIAPTERLEFPALFLTGYDFLFVVAFILGLLTLNLLAGIREEGAADREEAMEELIAQTRDNLRLMNSVPGFNLMSHIPYGHSMMRRIPGLPGLDVAVGVTAYQLAVSTRDAVTAASRGGLTALNVANRINTAVSGAIRHAGDLGHQVGSEVARHATRGALQAVDVVSGNMAHVTRGAVLGTIRALRRHNVAPQDVLAGAMYGVIVGAGESGADIAEVAVHAVEGAREMAEELGLTQDQAAAEAARGVIDAARNFGPEAESRVRDAILEGFLEPTHTADGEDDDSQARRLE
jgi:MFS family permease